MSAARWRTLIAGSSWVAMIAAYAVASARLDLTPLQTLRALVTFLAENPWGPLVFIAAYALRPLVLFSAGLLSIAGGILFGPFWGVVYTVIGSNAGAGLAYLLGRIFGEDLLPAAGEEGEGSDEQDGRGRWRRYLDRIKDNTFVTVLLLRTLYAPYDLVTVLAGLVRAPFWAFLLATALGSLPGTISFTLLGASAGLDGWPPSLDPWTLAASVAIFVASLALSRLLRRREPAAAAKSSHSDPTDPAPPAPQSASEPEGDPA